MYCVCIVCVYMYCMCTHVYVYVFMLCVMHGVYVTLLLYAIGRGRLRINKIENVGKALTFLTQEKKVFII